MNKKKVYEDLFICCECGFSEYYEIVNINIHENLKSCPHCGGTMWNNINHLEGFQIKYESQCKKCMIECCAYKHDGLYEILIDNGYNLCNMIDDGFKFNSKINKNILKQAKDFNIPKTKRYLF